MLSLSLDSSLQHFISLFLLWLYIIILYVHCKLIFFIMFGFCFCVLCTKTSLLFCHLYTFCVLCMQTFSHIYYRNNYCYIFLFYNIRIFNTFASTYSYIESYIFYLILLLSYNSLLEKTSPTLPSVDYFRNIKNRLPIAFIFPAIEKRFSLRFKYSFLSVYFNYFLSSSHSDAPTPSAA